MLYSILLAGGKNTDKKGEGEEIGKREKKMETARF
jgi:hypothetical protein